uniref:PIR protein n=1 Tax=Strongyloides venezuelensis TaxID=75913 RepID=A0A0K0EW71_STRVS
MSAFLLVAEKVLSAIGKGISALVQNNIEKAQLAGKRQVLDLASEPLNKNIVNRNNITVVQKSSSENIVTSNNSVENVSHIAVNNTINFIKDDNKDGGPGLDKNIIIIISCSAAAFLILLLVIFVLIILLNNKKRSRSSEQNVVVPYPPYSSSQSFSNGRTMSYSKTSRSKSSRPKSSRLKSRSRNRSDSNRNSELKSNR